MKFKVWGQHMHWYCIQIFFKNECKMFSLIILKVPTTVCLHWLLLCLPRKRARFCFFFFFKITKNTRKQAFLTVQNSLYSSILCCLSGQTRARRASTKCPSFSPLYDTSRFLWLIGITGKIPQINTCSQYLILRKLKSNKLQRTQ